MPTNKSKYMAAASALTVIVIGSIFLIPAPYKWFCSLGGYLLLLLVSLSYQKTHKQCMATIKKLDQEHKYSEMIEYISQIKSVGYNGFVVDSYLLYAHYELGDFKAYEEVVLSIRNTRAWKRPKFEDFRNKVKDNLACISMLKNYADTGEVNYKGTNLMMMQAVSYYAQNNQEAIISMLSEYPKIPKLKKVCMNILGGNFEAVEGVYESEIAVSLINQIKERKING